MKIQDSISAALEQVLQSIESPISGLALLTDTGMTTLHCMALSKEHLEQNHGDVDLPWMPFDWDLDLNPPGFNQASLNLEELCGHEAPGDYSTRADRACTALAAALRTLRQRHPELAESYMTVVAPDSAEPCLTLEGQVVLSLNGPGISKRWQEWRESWL
jgi:hypothetical protein